MTDRERLLSFLNENDQLNSIEEILDYYLSVFYGDISALQLGKMMTVVNDILVQKVRGLMITKSIAQERAFYLKTYLSGEMWLTEEAAKANVQPQINNAQAILDACNNT